MTSPLHTPDGRYIVVRGRLWRAANPNLDPRRRETLIGELMAYRREIRSARQRDDDAALSAARAGVNAVKQRLGERGVPWWRDGAPDYNRHMVGNTPYAEWYETKTVTPPTPQKRGRTAGKA